MGRVHVPSWLVGRATAYAVKRLSDTELRDAGAVAVYDSLAGLQADLDRIIRG